jgi:hypothetical protein
MPNQNDQSKGDKKSSGVGKAVRKVVTAAAAGFVAKQVTKTKVPTKDILLKAITTGSVKKAVSSALTTPQKEVLKSFSALRESQKSLSNKKTVGVASQKASSNSSIKSKLSNFLNKTSSKIRNKNQTQDLETDQSFEDISEKVQSDLENAKSAHDIAKNRAKRAEISTSLTARKGAQTTQSTNNTFDDDEDGDEN